MNKYYFYINRGLYAIGSKNIILTSLIIIFLGLLIYSLVLNNQWMIIKGHVHNQEKVIKNITLEKGSVPSHIALKKDDDLDVFFILQIKIKEHNLDLEDINYSKVKSNESSAIIYKVKAFGTYIDIKKFIADIEASNIFYVDAILMERNAEDDILDLSVDVVYKGDAHAQ